LKTKHVLILAAILPSIVTFTIGFFVGWHNVINSIEAQGNVIIHESKVPKDYKDVGGNIDIEYYLEVSEDSIWVENVTSHRISGGKHSDLDSLINEVNR
jgi:hypothetical protein